METFTKGDEKHLIKGRMHPGECDVDENIDDYSWDQSGTKKGNRKPIARVQHI